MSVLLLSAITAACSTASIPQTGLRPDLAREAERTAPPSAQQPQSQPAPQSSSQSSRSSTDRRDVPWEVTLSAGGTNDKRFDVGTGSINASVGYYFTEVIELVARQSSSYVENEGAGADDVWAHQSRIALDLHLPLGNFVPYVGANVGYLYGDTPADETFAAGPEAGVKIYLQRAAFLFVAAEYEFFFDEQETVDDAFEDGQFFYTAGFGLRF